MVEHRIARRTEIRLEVIVETILSSGPATMTDISETGAKVMYPGARPGERVSLVALGQNVCGIVAWADPDRFGMKFDQCLESGPVHGYLRRLMTAPERAPDARSFGRRVA